MTALQKSTAIVIVLCASLGIIFKMALFPAVPSSDPFPNSKYLEVQNLASAYEEESTPSWEFERSSSSADQVVRMLLGGLYFSLISIPIFFIYKGCVRNRHNETGTEQESSEIRMLLQEGERLIQELKTMSALMKHAESHPEAEFPEEMDSMRNIAKEEERGYVEMKEELDSMKALMTVQSEHLAQFQNVMDAARNMINMEKKSCTQFWEDINSMKNILDKSLSIRKKEAVRHPAPKLVPIKLKSPKEPTLKYPRSAAKEMKAPRQSPAKQP
jgi:hypothetical protein